MHQALKQRQIVFEYIKAQGQRGATADEIQAGTGMSSNSLTARLWELSGRNRKAPELKQVEMTDTKRKTRSGRQARVYVALIFRAAS